MGASLASLAVGAENCSNYASCGHKGARYATCDAYNDCVKRNAEAERQRRADADKSPRVGENKKPSRDESVNDGARRAE